MDYINLVLGDSLSFFRRSPGQLSTVMAKVVYRHEDAAVVSRCRCSRKDLSDRRCS